MANLKASDFPPPTASTETLPSNMESAVIIWIFDLFLESAYSALLFSSIQSSKDCPSIPYSFH